MATSGYFLLSNTVFVDGVDYRKSLYKVYCFLTL